MSLRNTLSRLRKLFASRDLAQIEQGVELALSLNDPEVFDALLHGVAWGERSEEGAPLGVILPGEFFTSNVKLTQRSNDHALRLLLARIPDTHAGARRVRKSVGALTLFPEDEGAVPSFDLGLLTRYPRLMLLEIRSVRSLENLSALADLPALESLSVQRAHAEGVADLSRTRSLKSLRFTSFTGAIGRLGAAPTLESLELSRCEGIKSLEFMAELTALKRLVVITAPDLDGLSALSRLTTLEHLEVGRIYAPTMTSLRGIENNRGLRSVALDAVTELQSLDGLQNMRALATVALTDVSALAGMTGLKHLALVGAKSLTDVSALATLTSLETLDLYDAHALRDARPFHELPCLKAISLGGTLIERVSLPRRLKPLVTMARDPDLAALAARQPPASATIDVDNERGR